MQNPDWYKISNTEHLITPTLLVYPERIEKNIQTMIKIAGGTEYLRPHIKTHKIAEIIKLQLKYGITKFKCATIAEAELLAMCKVKDILLAIQPVGVNIYRFFRLIEKYPNSEFSSITDNYETVEKISKIASEKSMIIPLWLDINNGMNRTGISDKVEALKLYQDIASNSNLIAKGLHVYDGHIKDSDLNLREKACNDAFKVVSNLKKDIENSGYKAPVIVAGGTPCFPIHAKRKEVEVSPGTPLLWDQGYKNTFKDLPFLPAAVLLGSIISKPKENIICLDIGHKAVAAEMTFPRMKILNINGCKQISHSEEHLVLEFNASNKYSIGDVCYAIPMHICPTVSKYNEVITILNGKINGSWQVVARDYKITI
ncbi:D-TA family PLP-dependent enzyme [Wocania ichthyoenteri]|uniref:D-TA family PLP-dependent enzyme n=1 Tax=Wocania ichthyoenteri TaxID=1230531 RepID=UPI00053E64B2|nr:D-TA family PLP-dependent enzyme [Wocania ichthyoenteri]